MAHSLSPECTPLKQAYDACFNTWFEGYLEPAIAHSKNVPPGQRNEYAKKKAEEFDQKCGAIWGQYKECMQVSAMPYVQDCLNFWGTWLTPTCRKPYENEVLRICLSRLDKTIRCASLHLYQKGAGRPRVQANRRRENSRPCTF